MSKQRRTFTPEFRAKVALAALRGEKTINQIASEFELHPVQVAQWKKQALEGLPASLEDRIRPTITMSTGRFLLWHPPIRAV